MYGIYSGKGYTEIIKGIRIKTLCNGESSPVREDYLKFVNDLDSIN